MHGRASLLKHQQPRSASDRRQTMVNAGELSFKNPHTITSNHRLATNRGSTMRRDVISLASQAPSC